MTCKPVIRYETRKPMLAKAELAPYGLVKDWVLYKQQAAQLEQLKLVAIREGKIPARTGRAPHDANPWTYPTEPSDAELTFDNFNRQENAKMPAYPWCEGMGADDTRD